MRFLMKQLSSWVSNRPCPKWNPKHPLSSYESAHTSSLTVEKKSAAELSKCISIASETENDKWIPCGLVDFMINVSAYKLCNLVLGHWPIQMIHSNTLARSGAKHVPAIWVIELLIHWKMLIHSETKQVIVFESLNHLTLDLFENIRQKHTSVWILKCKKEKKRKEK